MNKTLGTIVLAAISLIGCDGKENKDPFVYGKIVKETGTVARVVESRGALFGNESVKISEPTYVLQIQTDQGLYTASIKEHRKKPRDALALRIEEGTHVKIERVDLESSYRFGEDKIGYLYSNEVIVVK